MDAVEVVEAEAKEAAAAAAAAAVTAVTERLAYATYEFKKEQIGDRQDELRTFAMEVALGVSYRGEGLFIARPQQR